MKPNQRYFMRYHTNDSEIYAQLPEYPENEDPICYKANYEVCIRMKTLVYILLIIPLFSCKRISSETPSTSIC